MLNRMLEMTKERISELKNKFEEITKIQNRRGK